MFTRQVSSPRAPLRGAKIAVRSCGSHGLPLHVFIAARFIYRCTRATCLMLGERRPFEGLMRSSGATRSATVPALQRPFGKKRQSWPGGRHDTINRPRMGKEKPQARPPTDCLYKGRNN